MQTRFIRLPALLAVSLALGYVAGRVVYSAGMGGAFCLIMLSLACPALMCLIARSRRVAIGLLVNGVMALTVTTESYLFESRRGGLDGWWQGVPAFATFEAILVLSSLFVTIPASLPKKATQRVPAPAPGDV